MGAPLLTALITAALMIPAWQAWCRWLPEPVTDEPKIPYRNLAGWRHTLVVAGLSACAVWWSASAVPVWVWPQWIVLSTVGVALAAVDGWTTWIPGSSTRASWGLMGVAVILSGFAGGWRLLVASVLGAGIVGLAFLVGWLLRSGGMGFGDVRFSLLIGAATLPVGVSPLWWAVAAGLGLVVVWLVATRLLAGRRGQLAPLAPALLLGGYVALWSLR